MVRVTVNEVENKKAKRLVTPQKVTNRIPPPNARLNTMLHQTNHLVLVKAEYTDRKIVAQVLTWDRYGEKVEPQEITRMAINNGILTYQLGATKAIPIGVDQFDTFWKAIQAQKAEAEAKKQAQKAANEPEWKIEYTFTDFDGSEVDVVSKTINGVKETRMMWQEDTLDNIDFAIRTSSGAIVKASWKYGYKNSWLNAYRSIWTARNRQRNAEREAIERMEAERDAELYYLEMAYAAY